MILFKNGRLHLILWLFIIYFSSSLQLCSQKKSESGLKSGTYENVFKQDTTHPIRKQNVVAVELPDTNFTWEKYSAFLTKISDTTKYIVLPINEFRKTFNSRKIIIGLRHDVDNDLSVAYKFSETESKLGLRATYFILHTAPYYLANPANMAVHAPDILPVLKTMQNDRKFEIGWHNDLVTLQAVYNIDPVAFLHNELAWLRSNGINIYGTASHGSNYCYTYKYLNYYFFEECTYPVVGQFVNNVTLPINGTMVPMKKGKLSDFNLEYEAYFINNNKYFSDATITNGIRWNIDMLNLTQLNPGDRVMLLIHPIHWHKASVIADIESFSFKGQKSSIVDAATSSVKVEMPYKTDRSLLVASFKLSPGAYAKVAGKMQQNGITSNNFCDPVHYVVYAENREIHNEWLIKVLNAKNDSCDFKSFIIPGLTKSVVINPALKTILIRVGEEADLYHLPVRFELSTGATAWIGDHQQFNDNGTHILCNSVEYKIIAEDGNSSGLWVVTVEKVQNCANFLSYSIPGQIEPAKIDTAGNAIFIKVSKDLPLNELKASFNLSDGARAWIGKQEQFSDFNSVDFTIPVVYDIFSSDGHKIKKWKINIFQSTTTIKDLSMVEELKIYPNPTEGKVYLQFLNITTYPMRIDIFNANGEKVYTDLISKTGNFTVEADLSALPAGIYIVKYSHGRKSLMIILR